METEHADIRVENEGQENNVYDALHCVVDEDDPDYRCGLGSYRPACLQVFARIGAFVGLFSLSGLLTSSLSVYVNSQVPMLEKEFGFSSAESGLLMSCNDIGYLTCVIFAGYIAKKVHIPIGLGVSMILFGICGIMCALPYFLQDKSKYNLDFTAREDASNISMLATRSRNVPMCVNTSGSDTMSCDVTSDGDSSGEGVANLRIKKIAFYLIAFGMIFQGIGKSPRNPFTTLYVDDAVDQRKTGFYMGIIICASIFGPALALVLGGLFSKIYITLEPVDITPSDPRWVGAWWLGFIIFGTSSLVYSVPIMCFPRKMKTKKRRKLDAMMGRTTGQHDDVRVASSKIVQELKEFGQTVLRLLKNPVYVILVTSTFINLMGVSGTMPFLPKYMSLQFNSPLWVTNMIMAVHQIIVILKFLTLGLTSDPSLTNIAPVLPICIFALLSSALGSDELMMGKHRLATSASAVVGVSSGTFIGGVLTRKFVMTPQTTLKLMIVLCTISNVIYITGFIIGCEQPVLYGSNNAGVESPHYQLIQPSCNENCDCDEQKYFPICGDDGRSYFSPCHAGCSESSTKMFSNCTCIPSGTAVAGLCDQGCTTKLYVFAIQTFLGRVTTALKIAPLYIATIRCVEERDRAASAAVASFMTSALGWMPGPVITGSLIDGTCTLWSYSCGERQSCALYDIRNFRNVYHGYGTIAYCMAAIILVLLYVYFRVKGQKEWRDNGKTEAEMQTINLNAMNGLDRTYEPANRTEED